MNLRLESLASSLLKLALASHNNQIISKLKETKTEVPFLPEDVIFKILLLLPARVLRGVMTIVCRSWHKVIHDPVFIEAQRSCSTTSPFCLVIYDSYFRIYSLKNDKITWKYTTTINQVYLTHGDGFILTGKGNRLYDPLILNLVNPLTEQIISLPRLPESSWSNVAKYIVSCPPLTLKYKVKVVVLLYGRLYILTVGDDKEWREIDSSRQFSSRLLPIIGHHGLIYCYGGGAYNYLIALDVEKEVFHEVFAPKEVPMNTQEMYSGTSLVMNFSTITNRREFWELVDYRNGGEWRKFGIVDIESKEQEIVEIVGVHNRLFICGDNVKPVVVLSSDVMIFKFDRYFLAYNFKTEQFSGCFDYFRQSSKWKLMIDNNLVVL